MIIKKFVEEWNETVHKESLCSYGGAGCSFFLLADIGVLYSAGTYARGSEGKQSGIK